MVFPVVNKAVWKGKCAFRVNKFEYKTLCICVCEFEMVISFAFMNARKKDIMAEYIDLASITKRLKDVVEKSGLTSREFATRAGLSPATLSLNLNEKQQINVPTINKIIEHFSDLITPEELVFGISDSRPAVGILFDQGQANQDDLRAILQAQAEEIARLKAELKGRKEKGIAHITVFYDDNSFATFTTEGE